MPPRTAAPGQMDLLAWAPPQPAVQFAEAAVRASTLGGRISRAVATALTECAMPRAEIAQRMGEFLGEPISENMLNAYASQAREGHKVPACRLMALVHVTGDRRLFELMCEPFGWTVIDRRYLPLIQLATVREHEDQVRRHAEFLRRQARAGGLL